MKKLFTCSLLSLSILCTSCLGSFSAFNSLKEWNEGLSDNRFVNNLIFWGLNIVPVYGLSFIGDALIFNVIEFWSGSNPIAMKSGESETQIVVKNGTKMKMKATKNRFEIEILDGKRKGEKLDLVYKSSDKSWSAIKQNGEMIKLSSLEDGFIVYHLPNGDDFRIKRDLSLEESKTEMNEYISQYKENQQRVMVAQN